MDYTISIERAVLHVLDANTGIPVISRGELEISGDLEYYLTKHIEKVLNDPNTKTAMFTGDGNSFRNLCESLSQDENSFLPITEDIAYRFFDMIKKNVDIPSADLVCCIIQIDGVKYLGIMKLNYKEGFTHWVNSVESGNVISIIRHQTLLPQEGQKLEECALINLSDFGIRLIEKKYEINGEKEFYLSKYLLDSSCELSDNAKLKILDKVTKNMNKKYFDEDFEKTIKLKKAVSESFEETSAIQIQQIADKVFEKDMDIKHEYVEKIAKAGINEKEITVPDKLIEKKFRTHKIKTDTGIEIDFPLEYADSNDKIEFVNNPNGSISIIIKNISKITNR